MGSQTNAVNRCNLIKKKITILTNNVSCNILNVKKVCCQTPQFLSVLCLFPPLTRDLNKGGAACQTKPRLNKQYINAKNSHTKNKAVARWLRRGLASLTEYWVPYKVKTKYLSKTHPNVSFSIFDPVRLC